MLLEKGLVTDKLPARTFEKLKEELRKNGVEIKYNRIEEDTLLIARAC